MNAQVVFRLLLSLVCCSLISQSTSIAEDLTNTSILEISVVLRSSLNLSEELSPKGAYCFPAGVPVNAIVSVTNVGNSTVVISPATYTHSGIGFFPIIFANGKQLTSSFQGFRGPLLLQAVKLEPRQGTLGSFMLTSDFSELGKPGRYSIKIAYQWNWPFYISVDDKARHPMGYDRLSTASDFVDFEIQSNRSFGLIHESMSKLEDVDKAYHVAQALLNCIGQKQSIPSGTTITQWSDSIIRLYGSLLKTRFPSQANEIVTSIINSASNTNQASRLEELFAGSQTSGRKTPKSLD